MPSESKCSEKAGFSYAKKVF